MKRNIMKLVAAMLVLVIAVSLVGCNKTDGNTDTNSKADALPDGAHLTPEQASGYVVKLGDYSGYEIDATTDSFKYALSQALQSCTPVKVKDRAVKEGDTVNMEYTGRYAESGEVFQGGSASGASLTIGSGSFIDGFEDGLIGAMPGEPVDLYLTFPEDYHNKDMAGVKVVFSVFINYISEYSEKDIEDAKRSVAISYAVDNALNTTEFAPALPNEFINAKVDTLIKEVEETAKQKEMTLEAYLKLIGYTEEEMRESALSYATEEARAEIMYLAIAHKEKLTLSDEEFASESARLAGEYGCKDVAEFYEKYGGEADVRNAIFLMKISDHIGSLCIIKE